MEVLGFFPNMGPPGWRTDDVALRAVIVVGTVTGKEPGFFASPGSVYTPFTVDISGVIRGEASAGQMRVAVEGGTVGCYTVHVDDTPALEPGTRYVFFLAEPAASESRLMDVFDTWAIDANNVVSTVEGPMALADLIDRIDRLEAGANPTIP